MSRRYEAYDKAGWTGDRDWIKDEYRVVMVTGKYKPDFKAHSSIADIKTSEIVATSDPLTGKRVDGSSVDADDPTFRGVSGPDVAAIVLIQYRGALSRLAAYIDEGDFPISPNGGDITLKWSDGASRIMTD